MATPTESLSESIQPSNENPTVYFLSATDLLALAELEALNQLLEKIYAVPNWSIYIRFDHKSEQEKLFNLLKHMEVLEKDSEAITTKKKFDSDTFTLQKIKIVAMDAIIKKPSQNDSVQLMIAVSEKLNNYLKENNMIQDGKAEEGLTNSRRCLVIVDKKKESIMAAESESMHGILIPFSDVTLLTKSYSHFIPIITKLENQNFSLCKIKTTMRKSDIAVEPAIADIYDNYVCQNVLRELQREIASTRFDTLLGNRVSIVMDGKKVHNVVPDGAKRILRKIKFAQHSAKEMGSEYTYKQALQDILYILEIRNKQKDNPLKNAWYTIFGGRTPRTKKFYREKYDQLKALENAMMKNDHLVPTPTVTVQT